MLYASQDRLDADIRKLADTAGHGTDFVIGSVDDERDYRNAAFFVGNTHAADQQARELVENVIELMYRLVGAFENDRHHAEPALVVIRTRRRSH